MSVAVAIVHWKDTVLVVDSSVDDTEPVEHEHNQVLDRNLRLDASQDNLEM